MRMVSRYNVVQAEQTKDLWRLAPYPSRMIAAAENMRYTIAQFQLASPRIIAQGSC